MNTNIFVTASALSDQDLLARLEAIAGKERVASAELVAHLAALDSRPSLFAAQGYGSLFSYCTQAPERYRVQFTIGQEAHEKLRRLQALLRREIPDGDPGAIFDRALTVLLEKVEKTKLGAAANPRSSRPIRPAADPTRPIRPETDPNPPIRRAADTAVREPAPPSRNVPPAPPSRALPPAVPSRNVPPGLPSRHVPREVKREVWQRDAGRCAFVSPTGRRCTEGTFLEFHHIQPYAKHGPATVANISLSLQAPQPIRGRADLWTARPVHRP